MCFLDSINIVRIDFPNFAIFIKELDICISVFRKICERARGFSRKRATRDYFSISDALIPLFPVLKPLKSLISLNFRFPSAILNSLVAVPNQPNSVKNEH